MREKLVQFKNNVLTFWSERSKGQKGMIIGGTALFLIAIITISVLASSSKYVPLYSGLTLQESGQITEELELRGIPYNLEDGGTTILVPDKESDQLLVDLAGQGIPRSGNIDYSFFSENSSWGITDNEFNIMKLDAMQTELANLIKGIEGIEDAKVMINLPEETIFVSDSLNEASASIVLHTRFGQEFKDNQIESLYHLVSKAIPNLPEDNIVIMNQFFEYYDQASASGNTDHFANHHEVKKEIERDLQRRLQQMLGTMVGMDSVIVSVTADIDSTNESRVEELIEPVDIENMEGLPVSIENIHETYTGRGGAGGVVGVGEEDIANYPGVIAGEDGDYELVKESVNNEFNKIYRDIVESPHKVRDLGIQVVVNNARGIEGDELLLLSQEEQNMVEEGINSILHSIITTSIDKNFGEVDPEEKVSVVFQPFSEQPIQPGGVIPAIPMWIYIVGAILLLLVILILILVLRNRRKEDPEFEGELLETEDDVEIADIGDQPLTESEIQLKQLEKLAEDSPEDFAKLLRSWISDD